ncbi:hypothetical protein, partial [Neisseria dentiae]|uniref:hypothetical protein n=1 Tax=Neisseria dentiae TaxID=194197 RepID=UPI0035A14779
KARRSRIVLENAQKSRNHHSSKKQKSFSIKSVNNPTFSHISGRLITAKYIRPSEKFDFQTA